MGLTASEDAQSKDKVIPLLEQRVRRDRTRPRRPGRSSDETRKDACHLAGQERP
jgi:hypothetical protein